MEKLMSLLGWVVVETILRSANVVALSYRIDELEKRMATVDQEMRERLADATSRVSARIDSLVSKVASLETDDQGRIDAALIADAQADADALRPSVEWLERMGSSDGNVVPEGDPVPADSAPVENAPVVDGPSPVAPSEGPLTADTPAEEPNNTGNTQEENN